MKLPTQCIVAGTMPTRCTVLALFTLLLTTVAACGPKTASLDAALSRYDRGLFATAQQMAETVAGNTSGNAKADAAYVAGMAALQQRHGAADARRWLTEATRSTDAAVRGRAHAMLGELDRREGKAEAAIRQYERAWPGLNGQQRRETAEAAMRLLAAAGDEAGAAAWRHRVSGSDAAPSTGGWTLQAGAFSSRNGADTHRRTLTDTSTKAGMGAPRVHHAKRSGRSMWLVQLGAFDSRAAAEAARRRVSQRVTGGMDLLIVRVP